MTAGQTLLLQRLEPYKLRSVGQNKWTFSSPLREESKASGSLEFQGDLGLIHDHGFGRGSGDAIIEALGLTWPDVLESRTRTTPTGQRTYYDYADEQGKLLFQSVRIPDADGKTFRQRRKDTNGEWIWDLKGVRRVLYRLPDLIAAGQDRIVFTVEGEKDTDNLRALGEVATTNPGGAGKWRREYSETLRGRHVVILRDNDEAGRRHGADVARSLSGVAASIKVLDLPGLGQKGDVSDWLADGHTVAELHALVKAAPIYNTETATPATPAAPETVCLATVEPRKAKWLWFGRLASGEMVVLTGAPGVGKGLLLCYIVARYTTGKCMHGDVEAAPAGHVLWIATEDAHDFALVPRLRAAGADRARVHAWNMDKPVSLPEDTDRIVAEVDRHECKILIIDPAPTLLDREHSSNNDADVRRSFAPLATACRARGCAPILVRHTNKRTLGSAMDRGGGSIGWTGMARIELMLGRAPAAEGKSDNDKSIVTLAPVKSNIGRWPRSLDMQIVEADDSARVDMVGETETTADDLCSQDRPRTAEKTEEATAIIRRVLADGKPHRQQEIEDAAETEKIGWRTIKRAKSALDVRSKQSAGSWWWCLAPAQEAKPLGSGPVAPWPPALQGESHAGTVTSNKIKNLHSQRATGPRDHTQPPGGTLAGRRGQESPSAPVAGRQPRNKFSSAAKPRRAQRKDHS